MKNSVSLVRLAGIDIRLHVSVVVIFVLIATLLGRQLLPQWHPDWSALKVWTSALATAVLFLASLLTHELSHAMVARRFGVEVPRITLFLFGGMAEVAGEAPGPKAEFWIAAAGPLMSLFLAVAFYLGATALLPADFAALVDDDPDRAFGALSVVATACLWLASVNFVLALFNLLPGFPMDGGRVLRAVLWWRSGDLMSATKRAALGGRIVGWGLIGAGFLAIAAGRLLDGVWLAIIGWFISHLASASVSQFVLDRALKQLSVGDLMRTRFDTVAADLSIADFVHDYLLRSGQIVWPVDAAGVTLGTVNLSDVTRVPKSERASRRVRDVMKPLDASTFLVPGLRGSEALRRAALSGDEPLPVVDGGDVVGLLYPADVVKRLNLHELDFELERDQRAV